MLGAIAGDIIGAPYEWHNIKREDFPLFVEKPTFTDDTVLTVATADVLLDERGHTSTKHRRMSPGDYAEKYVEYARAYPGRGYGGNFQDWTRRGGGEPYNSWGNGSAMRVSPVGFAFDDLETVLKEAERSAEVTHNHPEGIKGAQATASAIFMGRNGSSKDEIRSFICERFGYDLSETVAEIREYYTFDVSCQGSVPQAIIAFLESEDYEDAVRKAVSLGGDSDTIACITGGIAEAFYGGVPPAIAETALGALDDRMRKVVSEFGGVMRGIEYHAPKREAPEPAFDRLPKEVKQEVLEEKREDKARRKVYKARLREMTMGFTLLGGLVAGFLSIFATNQPIINLSVAICGAIASYFIVSRRWDYSLAACVYGGGTSAVLFVALKCIGAARPRFLWFVWIFLCAAGYFIAMEVDGRRSRIDDY